MIRARKMDNAVIKLLTERLCLTEIRLTNAAALVANRAHPPISEF